MIDASFGEILVTVEKLRWTIRHGEDVLRSEKRPRNFFMAYKDNEVRWEPLGVVAAFVSWKYVDMNLIDEAFRSMWTLTMNQLSFPQHHIAIHIHNLQRFCPRDQSLGEYCMVCEVLCEYCSCSARVLWPLNRAHPTSGVLAKYSQSPQLSPFHRAYHFHWITPSSSQACSFGSESLNSFMP